VGFDQPMARRAAAPQQQADHGDRARRRLGRRLAGGAGRLRGWFWGWVRLPAAGGVGGRWRGWGAGQSGGGSAAWSVPPPFRGQGWRGPAMAMFGTNQQIPCHGRGPGSGVALP
jgi:hypothetical protein